jgi:integrase
LTWNEIDYENGVIVPIGGRTKTRLRQAGPLTRAVPEVLAEIKRERQRGKVHNLETAQLVFVREDGSPISPNMLYKALRRACKRADVRDFHFHDSRHTAKTEWARVEVFQ